MQLNATLEACCFLAVARAHRWWPTPAERRHGLHEIIFWVLKLYDRILRIIPSVNSIVYISISYRGRAAKGHSRTLLWQIIMAY